MFKTLRLWLWLTLLPTNTKGIQHALDNFRVWYNQHRPHTAHGCQTPQEVWRGETPSEPIPIRARDQSGVVIHVKRRACRGDPSLPIIEVRIAA